MSNPNLNSIQFPDQQQFYYMKPDGTIVRLGMPPWFAVYIPPDMYSNVPNGGAMAFRPPSQVLGEAFVDAWPYAWPGPVDTCNCMNATRWDEVEHDDCAELLRSMLQPDGSFRYEFKPTDRLKVVPA